MKKIRLLLIEDNASDSILIKRSLERAGYSPDMHRVETSVELQEALHKQEWDLILSDYHLPRFDALSALTIYTGYGLDIPFIVVSGAIGEDIAVEAMRAGAHDYVMKSNLSRLPMAVERELRETEGRHKRKAAEQALRDSQEQLHQAQKLEAVGRLAGGIAHDFNNILLTILGNASLLRHKLARNDVELNEVSEIEKACNRATGLVNQLLTFTRKRRIQPQVLDLNEQLRSLDSLIGRLVGEDVVVETHLGDSLPKIKVDKSHLEQVVMNLVVNARDAMPKGGKIALETSLVRVSAPDKVSPEDFVRLKVTDTGQGMNAEIMDHIFEPFFTTKEVGKGTGLGLSTLYGIITQTGGFVHVDSAPGQGSTFLLHFPPCDQVATRPVQEKPSAEALPAKGECILLVEDEEDLRKMLKRTLSLNGYQVLDASNGKQGLEKASDTTQNIDILLSDVIMPEMTGFELAQRFREVRKGCRILLMSGYAEDILQRYQQDQAGFELISKPFTAKELLTKLRAMLLA